MAPPPAPADKCGVPPFTTPRLRTRVALATLLAVAGCGRPAPPVSPGPRPPAAQRPPVAAPGPSSRLPADVRVQSKGGIVTLPLDDYVAGVVAGELAVGALPVEVADRVLALQAIVTRTWAVANLGRHAREGFDVCATTHCQVMRAPQEVLAANRPLVQRAATATRGQVVRYAGRPIDAVFHADCGGATSRPAAVWGAAGHPYLTEVADASCLADPRSPWAHQATRDQLRTALNASPATAVGRRLDAVRVVETDASGRAVLVALDGERSPLVRGEELRAVLTRSFGARAVRSTRFTVRREGDRFSFSGRGFGHGVGLCQRGALARLLAGASVAAVLQTYYPGTTIDPPR